NPLQQTGNTQLLRPNSMQRRDCAVQDVIDTVIGTGLLDRSDVGGLFHNADHPLVAGRAGTIAARINICNIAAYGTKVKLFFKVGDGYRQGFGIVFRGTQDMESHSLRTLAADPGKFLEFVDQASHGLGKFRHDYAPYIPGIPRPPNMPP